MSFSSEMSYKMLKVFSRIWKLFCVSVIFYILSSEENKYSTSQIVSVLWCKNTAKYFHLFQPFIKEHLCWKSSSQATFKKLAVRKEINHLFVSSTRVFLTFFRTSTTIGFVSGVTNCFCTQKETEPAVNYSCRKIKIRQQFTAVYSWCLSSACPSSGDKRSEHFNKEPLLFSCSQSTNRLRDRAAKCQTAAAGGLNTAMLLSAALQGNNSCSHNEHIRTITQKQTIILCQCLLINALNCAGGLWIHILFILSKINE